MSTPPIRSAPWWGRLGAIVVPLALLACAQAPVPPKKLNEDARLERTVRLVAKAGPAECAALSDVLVDESFDLRCRAASALYWKCNRTAAADIGAKLCRSVEMGNAEAGAVLLLGYARPDTAVPCLQRVAKRPEMVKLTVSSKPVSIELAARVALARLGDATATEELRRALAQPSEPEALFLLGVLPDIEDREALRAAVKLLDDTREAPGVVAHATRTIRDVALEALVKRLSLAPSFAIEPGRRYGQQEIAEIRTAALRALSAPG